MCLSTFVPQADDDGLDLLVLDKQTRQTFGIQIKPRFASEVSPPGTVRFDMRLKNFHAASNEFPLVPIIDPAAGEPLRFWSMPFSDLRSIASLNGVESSDVIVSTGAKKVLAGATMATLDPGTR